MKPYFPIFRLFVILCAGATFALSTSHTTATASATASATATEDKTHPPTFEHYLELFHSLAQSSIDLQLETLAYSNEQNPIVALHFGDKTKPNIHINAVHHGDERISLEAVIAIINQLVETGNQPSGTGLHNYSYTFIPIVNPDGFIYSQRLSTNKVDLNRSYILERDETPIEIAAVKDTLAKTKPIAALAFHAGLEAILWPWGNKATPPKAAPILSAIGQNLAHQGKLAYYGQSFYDYKTKGEFIDYAYEKYGTFAFTAEVSYSRSIEPKTLVKTQKRAILIFNSLVNSLELLMNQKLVLKKNIKPNFVKFTQGNQAF